MSIQFSHGLERRCAAARLLRLWVRIPPGALMSVVSVVCCRVEVPESGWSLVQRSLTDSVVSCVWLETSWMRRPWPTGGCCAPPPQKLENIWEVWGSLRDDCQNCCLLTLKLCSAVHNSAVSESFAASIFRCFLLWRWRHFLSLCFCFLLHLRLHLICCIAKSLISVYEKSTILELKFLLSFWPSVLCLLNFFPSFLLFRCCFFYFFHFLILLVL